MTARPPKVWGYVRASTRKQENSPEIQRDHIRAYAKAQHGMGKMESEDVTFFVDSAVSGSTVWDTRPAGRALFNSIKIGDHIVIAKLDRAFRRVADCAEIMDRFERMKIKLHVVNLMGGAIDLSSPMGRFFIHVLAAFAEMERKFIQERVKDGQDRAKRKGKIWGGRAALGFKHQWVKVKGKTTRVSVPDPDERAIMKWIVGVKMADSSIGWEDIGKMLVRDGHINKWGRPWAPRTVRRAHKAELILQLKESMQVNNDDDMAEILLQATDEPVGVEINEQPTQEGQP